MTDSVRQLLLCRGLIKSLVLALSVPFLLCLSGCTFWGAEPAKITVRGKISLPPGVTSGTLLIGASAKSVEETSADPAGNTLKVVATKDLSGYELTLSEAQLKGLSKLQIFGLLVKNYQSTEIPKMKKGDLIGFYRNQTSVGLSLAERGSRTYTADLVVNREFKDKRVAIPIEVAGSDTATMVGVYCGEIRGFSASALDVDSVIFATELPKASGLQSGVLDFPLLQAKPVDLCYLFAFSDSNGNQTIDPGERFGFYEKVQSNAPAEFNISQTQSTPLRIELKRIAPTPSAQPILVRGSVAIDPNFAASMKRFFVVAVKQQDMAFTPEQIADGVLAFAPVDPNSRDFELDLSASGVAPGTRVTCFAIGDSRDYGLPALNDGDALGIAIQDNVLINKAVQFGVNPGFDIKVNRRYHDGNAKIKVAIENDYRGPMMLFAYAGPMSLDATGIDSTKVVGFATLRKTDSRTQAELPVYSIGQNWPMKLYVLGLLDSNNNQKPDPGESILLPLNESGVPVQVDVDRGSEVSSTLNYAYQLQIPSNQTISLSGRFAFTSQVSAKFVHIVVAQGENLDEVIEDPIRYVKASLKVPRSAGRYQVSLQNTSLKVGDNVFVMGLTGDSASDFPRITADTLIGIYTAGTGVGYQLKTGDNSGLDLVIDRLQYRDKVSLVGNIASPYRGKVLAMLYAGSPMDLVNQTFTPDGIVAVSQANKETERFSFKFQTLVSGLTLPLNCMPFMLEDANGNGQPDAGERAWYGFDAEKGAPLSLRVELGTVRVFDFNESRLLPEPSPVGISISGNVVVNAANAKGRTFVVLLDDDLPSLNPTEIARHIVAVKEIPAKGGSYSIDLSRSGLKVGDRVLMLGLFDRDGTGQGFPQLTPNDLIGIRTGTDSFASALKAGENSGFDLVIDRQVYDGQTTVSGRILGRVDSPSVLVAAYAGDFDGLTDFELDYSKVLGFTEVVGGVDPRFELPISAIGVPFPVKTYIVAVGDQNGNQKLDPGEKVYFHSGRNDKVPEKVELTSGNGLTFDLNLNFATQIPRGYAMPLSGVIEWQGADARGNEPAFLFVAKGESIDDITQSPLTAIKYLKRLSGRPASFDITLEETDLVPGDKVMLGVFLDKDSSLSLSPGDRLGIADIGLSGFTKTLSSGGLGGLNVKVNFTIYGTQKTVDAVVTEPSLSNYQGRIITAILSGAMTSFDMESIDVTKVIGYAAIDQTAGKSSLAIPILPVAQLPVSEATLVAIFDKNGNGLPDPGEDIGLVASKAGGLPEPVAITAQSADTLFINSKYTIPVPSGVNMTVAVAVESSFGVKADENPVNVAVLLEAPMGDLARQPLRYVKGFKSLTDLSEPSAFDLKATDLKPGDRITMLAFNREPGSNKAPGRLVEGAQVGVLFNSANFETAYSLKEGANDLGAAGFKLNLDRIFYEHSGSIQFKIDGSTQLRTGDTISIAAYAVDQNTANNFVSLAAQLSNIDYAKVIAVGKYVYNGVSSLNIPILPALGPGVVDATTRKVSNVVIAGFRDDNGNGKFDNNEPAAFYTESGSLVPSLKTISLTSNNLPGSLTFNGTANNVGTILQNLPFGIGH